jgi:hypothetical protein
MKNYFIPMLFIVVACSGQTGNKSSSDFRPSYKEIISTNSDSVGFIDYYDSTSNLYSNFKYGFSIKFPMDWSIDKGVAEHTIIRGYQEDYAASFSVNVIEIDIENPKTFSMWKFYDENRTLFESQFRDGIENLIKSELYDYNVKKVYVQNNEALQRDFIYNLKHLDKEIQMKGTMYQITKLPFTFTVGLHVPLIFYEEEPDRFDTLINGFMFGVIK